MKLIEQQYKTLDNYFSYLTNFGVMSDNALYQVVFSVLLLDTLTFFEDYVTESYVEDVNRILNQMNCCNCLVDYENIKQENTQPFYMLEDYS